MQDAPQIFANLGLGSSSIQLFGTGIYGLAKLIATIVFIVFVADSFGRRRSLLCSSVVLSVCMFYVGLYVRISPPVEGEKVPPAGYVALIAIYIFACTFEFGWGPVSVSDLVTIRLQLIVLLRSAGYTSLKSQPLD